MSRLAELSLDILLLAAVIWLASRFVVILIVVGTFLLITVALMLLERAMAD